MNEREFLKVLITVKGDILYDIHAVSFDYLEKKFKHTNDDVANGEYFKATYSPKNGKRLNDIEFYQLKINEIFIPDWFKGDNKKEIEFKLNHLVRSMIIVDEGDIYHQGAILSGNANITFAQHSVIFGMYEKAKIQFVDAKTEIWEMTDGTYVNVLQDNCIVHQMHGYSKIKNMRDNACVNLLYGQAKIGMMFDNSNIKILKGDAKVVEMHEKAKAKQLRHMSRVKEMHGNSYIDEMWDWSMIEKMFDDACIGYMDDEAKVGKMYGNSMIEYMAGNSVVEHLYQNSIVQKIVDKAQILQQELKNKKNKDK